MKRVRVMAAALVLLAGCRAVLGIESLEDVDGGTASDGGSGKDATLADASGDAADAADASVPRDAADASAPPNLCADAGPNCNMCCRSGSGGAEHLLEQYAVEAGCVCGAGQCAVECADGGFCTGQGGPPMPMSCGQCVGTALSTATPPCQGAQAACSRDPGCAPVLECLKSCP